MCCMKRQGSAGGAPSETSRHVLNAFRAGRVGQVISQVYRASISRFLALKKPEGETTRVVACSNGPAVYTEKNVCSERAREIHGKLSVEAAEANA